MNIIRPLRVAVGLHNLTTRPDRVVRTGIQEVVFQTLQQILASKDDSIEYVPVFRLPDRNFSEVSNFKAAHVNVSSIAFLGTLKELNVSFEEICARWPYLKNFFGKQSWDTSEQDELVLDLISACDVYYETALCDLRHVIQPLKLRNSKISIGQILFDVGPVVHPEFCDDGMHAWFGRQYLSNLRMLDFVVSISRHSALEVGRLLDLREQQSVQQYYCTLPTRCSAPVVCSVTEETSRTHFAELGIDSKSALIVSLATLEPRKNLVNLVKGFLRLRTLFPELAVNAKLLIIGGKGWKNAEFNELISQIETADIIRPGYLAEEVVQTLFERAACVVMPSHYEGFGIPVSRARFAGVPVITGVNSSLPEAAALNEIFVSPSSADEMAMALAMVLRKAREKKDAAEWKRLQVEPNVTQTSESWQEVMGNWNAIFREVAALKQQPSSKPEISFVKHWNKRPRIAIDVHNISINAYRLHKTGIQETVTQIFKAIPEAANRLGVDLIPIPRLSPNSERTRWTPTFSPSPDLVIDFLRSTGMRSDQLSPEFERLLFGDTLDLLDVLGTCDWFLITSQASVLDISGFESLLERGLRISHILYDLIPLTHPEFAHPLVCNWFSSTYVPSLVDHASLCIGISRHSVIEMQSAMGQRYSGEVRWRYLPVTKPKSNVYQNSSPLERPYFVILGSTDPRKNVAMILVAFEKLVDELRKAGVSTLPLLVQVGASGWDNSHLNQTMSRLEAQRVLLRTGYLADAEVWRYIRHSCALLMPSRFEGYGLPLAMAVSMGRPVVTCLNSSLPEVAGFEQACYVNPNSIDETALALRMLLTRSQSSRSEPQCNRLPTDWVDYLCDIVEMHKC